MVDEAEQEELFEAIARLDIVLSTYHENVTVSVLANDLSTVLCNLDHLLRRVNKLGIDW